MFTHASFRNRSSAQQEGKSRRGQATDVSSQLFRRRGIKTRVCAASLPLTFKEADLDISFLSHDEKRKTLCGLRLTTYLILHPLLFSTLACLIRGFCFLLGFLDQPSRLDNIGRKATFFQPHSPSSFSVRQLLRLPANSLSARRRLTTQTTAQHGSHRELDAPYAGELRLYLEALDLLPDCK